MHDTVPSLKKIIIRKKNNIRTSGILEYHGEAITLQWFNRYLANTVQFRIVDKAISFHLTGINLYSP